MKINNGRQHNGQLLTHLIAGFFFLLITLQITSAYSFDWPEYLFEDQFEKGDPFAWTYVPKENVIGDILTIQSDIRHSGKYSAKFFNKGSLTKAYSDKETNIDIVYYRAWFYLGSDFELASGSYAEFVASARTGVGKKIKIAIRNSAGKYLLYLRPPGNAVGTTELVKNRWYCLEARINHSGESDTTGEVTVWLNGIEEISADSLTIYPVANEIRAGLFQRNTGSLYLDDIKVDTKRINYQENNITLIHPDFLGKEGVSVIAIFTGDEDTDTLSATLTKAGQATGQEIFSQSGNLHGRIKFPINLKALDRAEYTLTLKLKGSSNQIKAETSHTFTNTFDVNMLVSIDEDGFILLDGKRFFPISPFALNKSKIADWAFKYCNILYGTDWANDGPEHSSVYMTLGQEFDMITFGPMHDDRWTNGDGTRPVTSADITGYINGLKNHPGNGFWSFLEEPIFKHYYADEQKQWWDLVKQHDPSRLNHVNYMGVFYHSMHNAGWNTKLQHCVYPYLVADIYGFDVYPVEYELDYSTLAKASDNAHNWNYGLIPYFAFVQTADVRSGKGGTPTPEQVKLITWLPIIHHAKGINWFHYTGVTPPENMAIMAEFTDTMKDLSPVVLQNSANIAVTTNAASKGTRIDTMIKEYNGNYYLFAARVAKRISTQEPVSINIDIKIETPENFSQVQIYNRYDRLTENHGSATATNNFSFQLTQTPVDPGTVHIAGKKDDNWMLMFDDGQGNIYRNYNYIKGKGKYNAGTINYATGEITFTFVNSYTGNPVNIPAGTDNLKVSYVPLRNAINLPAVDKTFTDTFTTEDVHIYRIDMSNGPAVPTGLTLKKTN